MQFLRGGSNIDNNVLSDMRGIGLKLDFEGFLLNWHKTSVKKSRLDVVMHVILLFEF